jgi:20S proteasome alpha/beta subunit
VTTIAYRAGVLAAADTRSMNGGWINHYTAEKLFRLPDGSIAGVCGTYAEAVRFVRWLQSGEVQPAPDLPESTIIRLHRDGSLTLYEASASFKVTVDFAAWGSGSPAANAAMYMGASAERAVEVAALLDDSTGGPVVSMKCEG